MSAMASDILSMSLIFTTLPTGELIRTGASENFCHFLWICEAIFSKLYVSRLRIDINQFMAIAETDERLVDVFVSDYDVDYWLHAMTEQIVRTGLSGPLQGRSVLTLIRRSPLKIVQKVSSLLNLPKFSPIRKNPLFSCSKPTS